MIWEAVARRRPGPRVVREAFQGYLYLAPVFLVLGFVITKKIVD